MPYGIFSRLITTQDYLKKIIGEFEFFSLEESLKIYMTQGTSLSY